jgi:hypothetical protein
LPLPATEWGEGWRPVSEDIDILCHSDNSSPGLSIDFHFKRSSLSDRETSSPAVCQSYVQDRTSHGRVQLTVACRKRDK